MLFIKTILVPPIKCQGIKTKLIPFLREHIAYDAFHCWIEPFCGSGVVAFNFAPKQAILADTNPYLIGFYQKLQDHSYTIFDIRNFLTYHGKLLQKNGSAYYLLMRQAFNENHDPLYFLFLNRCGFNGLIRFNRKGEYNVPFCQNPLRFSKAYITKICHQAEQVLAVMEGKDWRFLCQDFRETMAMAKTGDTVYLDPPYIGLHTDYFGAWTAGDAMELAELAKQSPADVYLSMWKGNAVRSNLHLVRDYAGFTLYEKEHFYQVGAKTDYRHAMTEVLAVQKK